MSRFLHEGSVHEVGGTWSTWQQPEEQETNKFNSFQTGTGSLREEGRIYKEGQLVRKAGGGWQCYF